MSQKCVTINAYEEIFCSAEFGVTKNNPEFWEKVFEHIRHLIDDKSQVLFLDDDEKNVATARAFGFDAVHYKGSGDLAAIW